jgi:general secretion pathway protein I
MTKAVIQKRDGKEGFTLLEVLVALSLLSIAVTIVFQLFSADLKAIALSEHYVAAAVRAESRMSEILSDEKLSEGSWTETSIEDYRIDVAVTNVFQARTDELPVRLLEVVLTVRWMKDRREKYLTFRSMKLVTRKV